MSRFWLVAWALAVALTWLLPNHYLPWTAFHMDAWMASMCLLAAVAVLVRGGPQWRLGRVHLLVAVLALSPLLQAAFGQVRFAGVAWLHCAYFLGLLLAILVGEQWERCHPGQALDALFLAIGLASFASVGLQLYQLLQLQGWEVWVMPDRFGRPFANFGQPNQLATFHLWGLLALAWAYLRGQTRGSIAWAGSAFLVLGLAMTVSRTSWIGFSLLVLAAWLWRDLWPTRRIGWAMLCLATWLAVCVPVAGAIREVLQDTLSFDGAHLARTTVSSEGRPEVWLMLLDAARVSPWWGYGWGQVQAAQLAVATAHSPKFAFFAHAHNIALELLLCLGIPIALGIIGFLTLWAWRVVRSVRAPESALPVLLLLVTANHALLELPLHYGYFLWPVGLVVGVVEAGRRHESLARLPRYLVWITWVVAVAMLGLIIRDYSRVEPEYQKLRFEWARIKTDPAQVPDVLLLDQFRAFVSAVRLEPRVGMSDAEVRLIHDVAQQFPSVAMFQKLARAQALNGRPREALHTLVTMCRIVPPEHCKGAQLGWQEDAVREPRLRAVPWPSMAQGA